MAGCVPADPTTICESRSFGPAPQFAANSPRVLALAERSGGVTVLRDLCALGSCAVGAELSEEFIPLATNKVDQVLLSGDGRHVVVRGGDQTWQVDLTQATPETRVGPANIDYLVGAMRGGRYMVLRDGSGLLALDAESDAPPVRIGEAEDNLLALALGDRHMVARRVLGGGEEELYLVPVAPDPKREIVKVGEPVLLTRGIAASRVVITRELDPENPSGVGHDLQVVVTLGDSPKSARTLVFEAADGQLSDAFDGGMVTSGEPLNDVDGLLPVSPDGGAVAYITPRGSVAAHKIGGASCLVRSANSGMHKLAGFSGDGQLFFESVEQNREGISHARVYTHKLGEANFQPLTPNDRSYHLEAVPSHAAFDSSAGSIPWAVAALDGRSYAVQPEANPRALTYQDVSYLPRSRSGFFDDAMWLFDAREDQETRLTRFELRRLMPVDTSGGVIRFELDDDAPLGCGDASCTDDQGLSPFARMFSAEASVCLATSRSAGWARGCVPASSRRQLVRTRLPTSEQP